MSNYESCSRREVIRQIARVAAIAGLGGNIPLRSVANRSLFFQKHHFNISACDWAIGKRADPAAFAVAKQIGLEGVQVSLGTTADNMHLRQTKIQQQYLQQSARTGVRISSLAIGELNKVPYKSAPETDAWVSDSIEVARRLRCKVILLAFFEKGDLRGDETGINEVIRKLKLVAPIAEKAGVILGIESWLSAAQHLDIITKVGSPNVQVYYDLANSSQMGYDIYAEIKMLGRQHICEVHAKENGLLLGQGKIDFIKTKQLLEEISYRGWVVLEGGVPKGASLLESCITNTRFLKSVFKDEKDS